MSKYLVVLTTVESGDEARELSKRLVEKSLAACVQVLGPISSTYRWKSKLETAQEWLCLIKTTEDLYPRLEKTIVGVHHYEVPEIVALPVTKGSQNYLSWLDGVAR